ncbi:MAG: acyltransferase family protein [Gemmataceae bacterium]
MATPLATRLVSLDAYRGFIMLAMASEGFALARVHMNLERLTAATSALGQAATGPLGAVSTLMPQRADLLPASPLWSFLGYQFEHVPWIGCAFWDLIQPSFMFMVGVALPYSLASRQARGESFRASLGHAVIRAAILVLLAVFLSSPQSLPRGLTPPSGPTTNWIFVNVLAQIGLGYVFVFLLVGRGLWVQVGALALILAGSVALFAWVPAPGSDYDWAAVGVPSNWPHLSGWFAHWDKNSNAAHLFDAWFLNLFPRVEPFRYNGGGYQTLNFIPSMATMILGLLAGELLRSERSGWVKFAWLVIASVVCLGLGTYLGQTVCPIVKRIWTPSWAVFSAGWTFAMLASFYRVIDLLGFRGWSFPLVVVGMNSIAMYCMSQQLRPWIRHNLQVHVGRWWLQGDYAPVVEATAILFVLWLICWWLYRQRIFLRI